MGSPLQPPFFMRRGAVSYTHLRSIAGVKLRTRAGMGRCQGGFCSPRVLEILCEELGVDPLEVTQCGGASNVLASRCGQLVQERTDRENRSLINERG